MKKDKTKNKERYVKRLKNMRQMRTRARLINSRFPHPDYRCAGRTLIRK